MKSAIASYKYPRVIEYLDALPRTTSGKIQRHVLRDAGQRTQNYRLTGATLYVTIEPCQMCVGAMVHARIARVVYGAAEPKAGAIESAMRAHEHPSLNHRMTATGGVLESESRAILQEFFKERRSQSAP